MAKLLSTKTNYLKIRTIFLFLLFFEIASFAGYLNPVVNVLVFGLILFFCLILSLKKLEYGVYFVLAELFIGSKGYLFYFNLADVSVSLRIGLFLIVMSVWLLRFLERPPLNPLLIKEGKEGWLKKFFSLPKDYLLFRKSKFFKYYILFFIFILWGLIWGVIRGNSFDNLFFDFNGWLYFALVLPFFDTIKSLKQIKNIFKILFASLLILGFKTIFIFWVFAHRLYTLMPSLYRWLSDNYIGEIGMLSNNFYRIFIQSQIYSLVGFFICILILMRIYANGKTNFFPQKRGLIYLLTILTSLTLLISFSRSYWVGLLVGIIVLFFGAKFVFPKLKHRVGKIILILLLIAILDIGLAFGLANFPKPSGEMISLTSMVEKRITKKEPAGMSRLNLLGPLFKKIINHPIIGSGFGTTVTYRSLDPRQVSITNPEGWYTTYAFEWGYLDVWLKIGLVGLIAYLVLIWKILQRGWEITYNPQLTTYNLMSFGLVLGLVGILATNIFSPYLNHPLGIGYIILFNVTLEVLILEKEKIPKETI